MITLEEEARRRLHVPEVSPVVAVVSESLKDGVMTGNEIRHKTGLRHEDVYTALVWLEARGKAALRCHLKHEGGTVAVWSAA